METKHTPGPWLAACDPMHYDTLSTVVAGEMRAKRPDQRMIVQVGGFAGPAEQEANTRLIAAAPELLEACRALLDVLGTSYSTQKPVPVNCPQAAIAHAAISKAIGA